MDALEIVLLIALGGVAIAMVYLARELERVRAVIEPALTSPLFQALTR